MPRKSGPFDTLMVLSKVEGHTSNADLTMIRHGGRCPDLSGSAGAFIIGHETKKDIPVLTMEFYAYIIMKRHSASSSWPRGSIGVICEHLSTNAIHNS